MACVREQTSRLRPVSQAAGFFAATRRLGDEVAELTFEGLAGLAAALLVVARLPGMDAVVGFAGDFVRDLPALAVDLTGLAGSVRVPSGAVFSPCLARVFVAGFADAAPP